MTKRPEKPKSTKDISRHITPTRNDHQLTGRDVLHHMWPLIRLHENSYLVVSPTRIVTSWFLTQHHPILVLVFGWGVCKGLLLSILWIFREVQKSPLEGSLRLDGLSLWRTKSVVVSDTVPSVKDITPGKKQSVHSLWSVRVALNDWRSSLHNKITDIIIGRWNKTSDQFVYLKCLRMRLCTRCQPERRSLPLQFQNSFDEFFPASQLQRLLSPTYG